MSTIFLVVHSSGEYEDHRDYNLKAFTTKEGAEAFAKECQDQCDDEVKRFEPLYEKWRDSLDEESGYQEREAKRPKFSVANDPEADHWDDIRYSVEEIDLVSDAVNPSQMEGKM